MLCKLLWLQLYDVTGIGAWLTVYVKYRQCFNILQTALSKETSAFLKQIIIVNSLNSVFYLYNQLSLSRLPLSRITPYLEEKI